MVDLMHCLTNLLFLDIPLLHYYINLRSEIIFCPFPGVVYLSLGIFLSCSIFSISLVTVPKLFCGDVHDTLIILLVILLPIKSPVASAVF